MFMLRSTTEQMPALVYISIDCRGSLEYILWFQAQQEFRMKSGSNSSGGDENSGSALNLSNAGNGSGRGEGAGRHQERQERERRRAPSSPLSINAGEGLNQVSILLNFR
jgi:hypothetical protein